MSKGGRVKCWEKGKGGVRVKGSREDRVRGGEKGV